MKFSSRLSTMYPFILTVILMVLATGCSDCYRP
jgi:hypothetical protein